MTKRAFLPLPARTLRRAALLLAVAAAMLAGQSQASTPVSLLPAEPSEIHRISDGSVVGGVEMLPQLADSLSAIGMPAVRARYPQLTGSGQAVAIIDTGIDYTHPALAGRYLGGWDFGSMDADPIDDNPTTGGHGTHVAGIVASNDATYGGVAPGAGLVALKVFDSSTAATSASRIDQALNWVAANAATYNITAVNISLGDGRSLTQSDTSPVNSTAQAVASLRSMGIMVSAASGNNGYLEGVNIPAALEGVVSVGGTWASDAWSEYAFIWDDPYNWNGEPARMADNGPVSDDLMVLSNRYRLEWNDELDLLAPGAIITSSVPVALDTDGTADGWGAKLGTSMAAPHVAAASVLVRQALIDTGQLASDPAQQVDQILEILKLTAQPIRDWHHELGGDHSNIAESPAYSDEWYLRPGSSSGQEVYGRLDVEAAIDHVYGVPEPATISLLVCGAAGVLLRRRSSPRR